MVCTYLHCAKICHEGRLYRNYGVILIIIFLYRYTRHRIRSLKCALWLLVTVCVIYIGNMLEVIVVFVCVAALSYFRVYVVALLCDDDDVISLYFYRKYTNDAMITMRCSTFV